MATSEFGKAFASARSAGLKTFEHNGKKYTTELAKPASRAATPAQSDKIMARKAADTPGQTARNARSQSNTDMTRSSRLAAQAAERNVVEQARRRQASEASSNYGNEGRRTAAPAAKGKSMTVAEINSKIGSKLKSTLGTQAMRDAAKKGA